MIDFKNARWKPEIIIIIIIIIIITITSMVKTFYTHSVKRVGINTEFRNDKKVQDAHTAAPERK